ncbi:PP2C family protein-serine/threonine phosphatase [Streptomyces ureilyticus]|uniref:Serine/threonine-protein phosphatase n=1 Tax=Streptomyces ureilyticus TaxID=1775131 RepID=A0ABX0DIP2_9ACTN|nr:PP2C family protein-serine/threonine phosphatase [Streptomyces ureilyticus]NGO41728.1 serine/threonine-protein phosphatase [Streptomyces ureilyticus]
MIRTIARGGARVGASRVWRTLLLVLPGLWVAAVLLWEILSPPQAQLIQLLAAAPAIACAGTGRRSCVLLGGLCAAFALVPVGTAGRDESIGTRCGTFAAILAVVLASYLTAGRRARLQRELESARAVADAAQAVVLRPLPPRLDGLALAAGQLSASRGAAVGGDLYEVMATAHGVRVVMGDVRGHGLAAIGTVAALLGSFRDAAHEEAEFADVLRRLERALDRHHRERSRHEHPASSATDPPSPVAEDFVTVLLLEIRPDGTVHALNCGHPWPYLLTPGQAEPFAQAEPLPPLGLFPLPEKLPLTDCGQLLPGEALFLHTDGAEDARNGKGHFFPLPAALTEAAKAQPVEPRDVLRDVFTGLQHHTAGSTTDDVAILVLRNDRPALSAPLGARGCDIGGSAAGARPATTDPQSTNHL